MDTTYYIDRDPRPKLYVCKHCARDVQEGFRCICTPSTPRGEKVVFQNKPVKYKAK